MTLHHHTRLPLIALTAVCLAVFILRAAFYSKQDFLLGYDSANYATVADNIIHGHGFSVNFVLNYFVKYPSVSHPEDRRLSINSLFIALPFLILGKGPFAAKLINTFLGSFSIPLSTYFLASLLSPSRSAALLAALSTIVLHNLSEQTYTALADLLLAQFFLLFIISLFKSSASPRWHNLTGTSAGLAFLTKTQGLILLPLWLIYGLATALTIPFFKSKHLISSAVLCISIMSPFLIRNFLLFGDPLFTTIRYNAPYDELFDTHTLTWQERMLTVYWNGPPPDHSDQLSSTGISQTLHKLLRQFRQAGHLVGKFFFLVPILGFFLPGAHRQRLLLTLILAYIVIISTFFAFHQRYEIPLIPPLVVSAWSLLFHLLRSSFQAPLLKSRSIKPSTLSLLTTTCLAFSFVLVHRQDFVTFKDALTSRPHPFQESLIDIAKWAANNLPPSAVVMTHDPPLFNFYSGLKCVQIPYDDLDALKSVAAHYRVTHAVPWTVGQGRYLELAKASHGMNPNILLLNPALPYATLDQIARRGTLLYQNNRLRLYSTKM